jgi:predicted Rdx family selenoprotein
VAAELASTNYRETGITLTPAEKGVFQVFVDGKKLYDRQEPGAVDFLPALREIHKIRDTVREMLGEPVPAASH